MIGVAPGQVDGFATVDTGLAKLAELAVDVVQSGCGSDRDRAARSHGRCRTSRAGSCAAADGSSGWSGRRSAGRRRGRTAPSISRRRSRSQPDRSHHSGRSSIQMVVEPGRLRQPVREGGGGQQGDVGAGMVAADRGERAERQDDVAEGAKLDDQDAAAGPPSRWGMGGGPVAGDVDATGDPDAGEAARHDRAAAPGRRRGRDGR